MSNSVERDVLTSVKAALERRSGRKAIIPDKFTITSLDVVVHYDKLKGRGGFARVYEGTYRGKRVAIKQLEMRFPPSVRLYALSFIAVSESITRYSSER